MDRRSPSYRGKRVLVTGGAGYIGSELAARLHGEGAEVTLVVRNADRVPAASIATEVVSVDLQREPLPSRLLDRCDVLFHLASQTSAQVAAREPEADWERNVRPVLRALVQLATMARRPRLVFASTVTVTGLPKHLPVGEDEPCWPVTVYDQHKLDAERYLEWFHAEHGIETTVLRLANVYGPSQAKSGQDRGVLQKMARLALAGGPLTVQGSGDWRRDYVYIDDTVEAFLLSGIVSSEHVAGRRFHVCSGTGIPFRDAVAAIAEEAKAITGRSVEIRFDPTAKLDAIARRDFIGDPTRLKEAVGWAPRVAFREGIRRLLTRLGGTR